MKTSKILALLLLFAMSLSLLACDLGLDFLTEETTIEETAPETEPTTEPSTEPDSEPDSEPETDPELDTETDPVPYITIAEALELCGESGNITKERYYIRATVKSITNAQYGSMIIYDATGEISVYGTYSEDGSIKYGDMADKPYKGDEVVLYCILQNYNGTK